MFNLISRKLKLTNYEIYKCFFIYILKHLWHFKETHYQLLHSGYKNVFSWENVIINRRRISTKCSRTQGMKVYYSI